MNDRRKERIILEFQERRRKMLRGFGFCAAFIGLAMAVLIAADFFPESGGILGIEWSAIAASQFIVGVVFALIGFRRYRCPVCDEIPRGHDRYYFGVLIDPERCPNCGAKLS